MRRTVTIDKGPLDAAFEELRRRGYIARRSFKCCSSCAGHALGVELGKIASEGRQLPRGAVYYHRQDAESLMRTGGTMLRFGRVEHWSDDAVTVATPVETVDVGREVCEVLAAAGVKHEWDGDPDVCIEIDLRLN